MRRPLLLFLFLQCFVISVLVYLDPLGLGSFILPKGRLPESSGQICTVEGVVTGVSIKQSYAAVTVKTGGEKVLLRFKVSGQDELVYDLTGRRASASGQLELPDGRRNPGCFDYRLYLKGRRVFTIMEVSKYHLSAGPVVRPFTHLLSVLKGRFFRAVRPYMDDRSFQITAGLLFGETSLMDSDLYEQFRLNGISHILAVSGLHVGLLYATAAKLFGKKRSIKTSAAIIGALFVYAALSNFSVSVLRASLMIFLHILAGHLNRRYDMVCAATLAASVFLLINPWQLFDTGFQLSFCAAYTMGIALPWATSKGIELSDKHKKRWIMYVFGIFSPCAMVQLGMTPLIMFHYTTFSPVSILLNPLAVVLAGLLLPAGLACFIVSLVFTGIPLIGSAGIAEGFAYALRLLSEAGEYIGGSTYCAAPPFSTLLIYYFLFFWFFSETRTVMRRRRKHPALLAIFTGMIAAGCVFPRSVGIAESMIPWRYDTHPVTFVDVGQGDCIHFCIDGFNILVDGGGNTARDKLRPYLLKNGISAVDLAIITHDDMDHALGIRQLEELMPVKQTILLGEDNEDCGVMMINACGAGVLLMSDADMNMEHTLCENFGTALACDILKVGHHGSRFSTSDELLACAAPHFAVISCGKNNMYGHPSDRVVELLADSGIIYARTDECGAVYLQSISEDCLEFRNAAKDRTWHIQRIRQIQNTPPGP